MYPRTNYEMTKEDLSELLNACKPTPCIMIGGTTGPSQQENANNAWKRLGEKMGFDSSTVRPINGKGNEFFSAVPSETEQQKDLRLKKEAEKIKSDRISTLKAEIVCRQVELDELKSVQ